MYASLFFALFKFSYLKPLQILKCSGDTSQPKVEPSPTFLTICLFYLKIIFFCWTFDVLCVLSFRCKLNCLVVTLLKLRKGVNMSKEQTYGFYHTNYERAAEFHSKHYKHIFHLVVLDNEFREVYDDKDDFWSICRSLASCLYYYPIAHYYYNIFDVASNQFISSQEFLSWFDYEERTIILN